MTATTYIASACNNCVIVAANDDYSGVDASDPAPLGLLAAGDRVIDYGDGDTYFSWNRCDLCDAIAGDRTDVTVLTNW